jgi:hypothetical protein
MAQFYVINETSEDTLGSAENLSDAVCTAKEAARQGRAGDLVSVLERGGRAVRQFVLRPDGTVAEQAIARRVSSPPREAGFNGAERVGSADRPSD